MALTTIKTTAIADDAVTADKLANSINSEIAANTAKVSLGSDSVTAAKIADDAINSEHYTDGSIDTAHIAADQITGAKIADDAVGSEHIEVLDAALQFGDSVKAQFGAGNDLEIYHDASNSYLDETGTGSLILRASPSIEFRKAGATEKMLYAEPDAQVELYYDNSKKLDTLSGGVQVHGNLYQHDNAKAVYGTGDDLQIYHDASNTYFYNSGTGSVIHRVTNGDIFFQYYDGSSAEDMARLSINGGVELYYDNSKKLNTQSGGVTVTGYIQMDGTEGSAAAGNIYVEDDGIIKLGDGGDFELKHVSDVNYIQSHNNRNLEIKHGSDISIKSVNDGVVELYYDGSKKFETTGDSGGGIKVFNDIIMPDSGVIRLGAASGGDLKIYHDGTDNYIYSNDKTLYINANSTGTAKIQIAAINAEKNADFKPNGAVELYYDNSKKFETVSGGATITGTCTATSFAGDGSNLTGITANHTGIDFDDNVKSYWGTGNDLEIYHDGSHSYVRDVGVGELRLASESNTRITKADSETCANFTPDGPVELYYDNSKKFETVSGGAQWFGDLYGLDDDRLSLGSGNDILIYHDSSNSYLKNSTGVFSIRNTSGSNLDLYSNANVVIRVNAGENALVANHNGAVELYYDNTKMWETNSSGTLMPDDKYAYYGSNGDMYIGHNGSHGYLRCGTGNLNIRTGGTLWIDNAAGDETYIKAVENAGVELYYNNSKKFETVADGNKMTDNGSYQLTVKRDGNATQQAGIKFLDGTDETARVVSWSGHINLGVGVGGGAYEDALQCDKNGSVDLYYDNSKKLATDSGGVNVTGGLNASGNIVCTADGGKFIAGAGDDLQIYHDSGEDQIRGTGTKMEIRSPSLRLQAGSAEAYITCTSDDSVELHFDGSKKLETKSTGLKMWGTGTGDGIFEHDNTTANNDRYLEIRNARSGSSRGRTAQMMIGENSSSEGDVIVRTSAANADVSGGVRLSNAATSWSAMSDIRLKDKTGDITNALVDIAKIEPLKFTWKSDTNKTPQVGVSAQSVENVVPEAVSKSVDVTLKEKGDNTEYLSVKYTELIPLCIAALKEAKTKIETLETKLAALESS